MPRGNYNIHLEHGCFKMAYFVKPHATGNCTHCLENSCLQTGQIQMGHCPKATLIWCLVWKRGSPKRGILKSLVSHVLNFKSWIKLICHKITEMYCVINEFDQLLRFKTWETRLFKMPRLKTPRLVTGTRIAVASELGKVHFFVTKDDGRMDKQMSL